MLAAATLVFLGGILSVVALYAGAWVEGKATASGGDSTAISASISLQPGAICAASQSSANGGELITQCFRDGQIEANWAGLSAVIVLPNPANKLPESVTASNTAAILGNTYNLVAAGVRQRLRL